MEPLTSVSVPMLETSFSNGGVSPALLTRVRHFSGGVSSPTPSNRQAQAPAVSSATNAGHAKDDFEAQFVRVLQKVYSSIQKNEVSEYSGQSEGNEDIRPGFRCAYSNKIGETWSS